MSKKNSRPKTRMLAWGITGAGDKLPETIEAMKKIKAKDYIVDVFVSKEGETVLKWYKQFEEVSNAFDSCTIESGPNAPFILGDLQTGKYDALIISPATANTVAKVVHGIADTLLTNAVAQTAKTDIPIYIYPVDQKKGKIKTHAPNGREFYLKMREVDVENSKKLKKMENVKVLKSPEKLKKYFK
ncbi:Coenzyme A biosynthesis bifunctional protein CoaBC [Methanimicrococcus sp. At1]|uniref:Coenzyme A biosynthesis bifunctional protein CoaBC n=1 Tax=Methanimicrococcus hacksteinii TaxID=3028293 RepID=A0ABU3VNR0_9EURY|nr:archaeoflavoprotein AfpA [Methanimicrococcus sp. At1]MDV0445033.1 Coenzyme A biosynthesis bifunctional protein CoaBC [Methanimicrococcus sp. At1]